MANSYSSNELKGMLEQAQKLQEVQHYFYSSIILDYKDMVEIQRNLAYAIEHIQKYAMERIVDIEPLDLPW